MPVVINESNFLLYAAKHYDGKNSSVEDFYADLMIPSYLKKIFLRYAETGQINSRRTINHIVIFFNVFEPEAALRILFYKIPKKHHNILKTLLICLQRLPVDYTTVNGINTKALPIDYNLVAKLRESLNN